MDGSGCQERDIRHSEAVGDRGRLPKVGLSPPSSAIARAAYNEGRAPAFVQILALPLRCESSSLGDLYHTDVILHSCDTSRTCGLMSPSLLR